MTREVTLPQLKELEGQSLAPTDWFEIHQERISRFAECTEDRQYIHVDPVQMGDSPWGTTIAHGFLMLSLTAGYPPVDMPQLRDAVMTLNYGLDRVRFLTPVPCGSRVRFTTRLLKVQEKAPGRVLLKLEKTLELQGVDKPALVAELLVMQLVEAGPGDAKQEQGDGNE